VSVLFETKVAAALFMRADLDCGQVVVHSFIYVYVLAAALKHASDNGALLLDTLLMRRNQRAESRAAIQKCHLLRKKLRFNSRAFFLVNFANRRRAMKCDHAEVTI
jgi:hypothetical protein